MEVIKTDLRKFLGQNIKVLKTNGETVAIKVISVQTNGGYQTITGTDLEGREISIDKKDMELIIN